MQDVNPYQAPLETSFAEPELDADSLPVASSNRRFLNFILDNIAFRFLIVSLALTSMVAGIDIWPTNRVYDIFLSIFLFMLYFTVQEAFWGRTLAKFITGTKVVTAEGGSPTVQQVIGRTLCRLIPFEAFTFFGKFPVGWHDKFSGTRVVLTRSR